MPIQRFELSKLTDRFRTPDQKRLLKHGNSIGSDYRVTFRNGLVRRWGDLESEAFALPGWFDLSKDEQLAHPKGREMADIDRMLSSLFDQRWKLLADLPSSTTSSMSARWSGTGAAG